MIESLLTEIKKNILLIIRQWSSLALIIITPLLLILLVGYTFSGTTVHGIHIGVISQGVLPDLESELATETSVTRYTQVSDCLRDLITERTHLCLDLKGNFSKANTPTEVTFYYDNTRKRISLLLISEVREYFGLTAERISLVSTGEIIANIQQLLRFLGARIDDIGTAQEVAQELEQDLTQRHVFLLHAYEDLNRNYTRIINLHRDVTLRIERTEERALLVNTSAEKIREDLTSLQLLLDDLEQQNVSVNQEDFALSLLRLNRSLDRTTREVDLTISDLQTLQRSLDVTVGHIGTVNKTLGEEIAVNEQYLQQIREGSRILTAVTADAQQQMQGLSGIDPTLAEFIVKPILQDFRALRDEVTDLAISFPLLMGTIIVFISLLFATVVALLEIHSQASIRSLLAPRNTLYLPAGILITASMLVAAQVFVLLVVAHFQFGISITSHLFALALISGLLIMMFAALGITIAYLSTTVQLAVLVSTFAALGFFLLSNAFVPLEAMPPLAAQIASYNPLVLTNKILRQVLFFDRSLFTVWKDLVILCIYVFTSFILCFATAAWMHRKRW